MNDDTTKKTEAVVAHHMRALIEGQLETVLSDFTEDSALILNDGCYRGLDAIRALFEAQIKNTPPELIDALTFVRQDVVGTVAYVLYKAEPFLPLSTDTFVVQNGKILVQTSFTPG